MAVTRAGAARMSAIIIRVIGFPHAIVHHMSAPDDEAWQLYAVVTMRATSRASSVVAENVFVTAGVLTNTIAVAIGRIEPAHIEENMPQYNARRDDKHTNKQNSNNR